MGQLAVAFHSADDCVPVVNRDTGTCSQQEVGIKPLTSTQSATGELEERLLTALTPRERTGLNLSNKVHQEYSFANGFQSPWFVSALTFNPMTVGQSMTILVTSMTANKIQAQLENETDPTRWN